MFMRKILAVLMLVCCLGLFAQIPAGTKSIALLTGGTSDLLADGDLEYDISLIGGYFIMDALEIDAILGLDSDLDAGDMAFELGIGVLYHFPLSPMFGLYGGAAFTYLTAFDGLMAVPIEAGLELFITQNNAVRLANIFTLNLEEGMDNTDHIAIGAVHYFQ
jgi:hypothetical protein